MFVKVKYYRKTTKGGPDAMQILACAMSNGLQHKIAYKRVITNLDSRC